MVADKRGEPPRREDIRPMGSTRSSRAPWFGCWLPCLTVLVAFPAFAQQTRPGPPTTQPDAEVTAEQRIRSARTIAEVFLALMFDGQFHEAADLTDEPLRSELGPGQMADLMTNFGTTAGHLQRPMLVDTAAAPHGNTELIYSVKGERLDLRLSVVVSPANKVVGVGYGADERTLPWQPPDYADPEAFREAEVQVGQAPWELGGTLSVPIGDGPFPGVVLVHGSGPHLRDQHVGPNRIFRDLAWGLATRGIAVLRYDKRSRIYGARSRKVGITVDAEVIDDAIAALEVLRAQPRVEPKRTFLLGHTLGATLAPEMAARDGKVAGIIMLAPAARPVLEVLRLQTEYRAKQDSGNPDARERVELIQDQIEQLRNRAIPPGEEVFGVTAGYWYDLSGRDGPRAVAAAREAACPILVLHAGRDAELTGDDLQIWEQALADRPTAALRYFDKLNHMFLPGEGPFALDEYFAPGHVDGTVIQLIAQWIQSQPETGR